MSIRLGRNDPCWCGSGKKFKRCHLDRDKQTPVTEWQAAKELRRRFGTKQCLVPQAWKGTCNGNIVQAHTIPRSGSLKRIARSGHVYAFVTSLENISKDTGVLQPQLWGINRASTFTGFCGYHDKDLFAPVEDEPFRYSDSQCFLLAYRALARECFNKNAAFNFSEFLREADKGRSLADQLAIQEEAQLHKMSLQMGAQDLNRHKSSYDRVLLSNRFSDVRSYVIKFEQPLPVMSSGGIFPEVDFDGRSIQDLAEYSLPAQLICFNSFAAGGGGTVVFTWLADSDPACDQFVSSLESVVDGSLFAAVVRFFFEFCENVFMSPNWWEGLDETQRLNLVHRLASGANPEHERPKSCLADDGVSYGHQPITERYRTHSKMLRS